MKWDCTGFEAHPNIKPMSTDNHINGQSYFCFELAMLKAKNNYVKIISS